MNDQLSPKTVPTPNAPMEASVRPTDVAGIVSEFQVQRSFTRSTMPSPAKWIRPARAASNPSRFQRPSS